MFNFVSGMASKLIYIRWVRTGSQPYLKIMYSIVLQTIYTIIKKIIELKPVLLALTVLSVVFKKSMFIMTITACLIL